MKAVIAATSRSAMSAVVREYPFVIAQDFRSFLEEVLKHSPKQRQKAVKQALKLLTDVADRAGAYDQVATPSPKAICCPKCANHTRTSKESKQPN
jgi:hypothetical protein